MSDVLVVAASGLGPFVQSLGALAALRVHHANDRIVLLTRPETAALAAASRYADVIVERADWPWWDVVAFWRFRFRLREFHLTAIYACDSDPHGWLRLALGRAAGSLLLEDAPEWRDLHVHDRLAARLRRAGITHMPPPDLTWVARRVTAFTLPFSMSEPFVLIDLDPSTRSGAAWPAERLAALVAAVTQARLKPVLVGAEPPPHLRDAIAAAAPATVDLTGPRSLSDLVFLAWTARGAMGCDTGLMHLFAAAGCRAVVLDDAASDPARTGQRGANVTILRRPALADIPAVEVLAALKSAFTRM